MPGATVTYAVTVTNTGQVPYSAATFTAPLAGVLDDAVYVGATSSTGTVSFTSPSLTWTGALAPAASATVGWTVTVRDPDPGDASLDTTLTSAAAGSNCAVGSGDTRCATSVPVAILTLRIVADTVTAVPGQVVRSTVTITDAGRTSFFGATAFADLSGALDDATYNGDQSATSGQLIRDPSTGQGGWVGDLTPGQTVTITGTVTIKNPDPGDRSVVTVMSSEVPGSTCPPASTNPDCTSTVAVLVPALTIATTVDHATTTPGGTVRFTVTITNSGQTPYTGAQVTDSLAGILTDATYNGDAFASSGGLAYTAPTLTWTGDLAPTGTVTITFTATVLDPDPGDKDLVNVVTSDESGSTCPTGGSDPACSADVNILVPALSIVSSADAASVTAGDTVLYTLVVANTGETAYTGIAVADDLTGVLDDATYDGNASPTSGQVSLTGSTLTWTGDLAAAGVATITFSVTTLLPDPGNQTLTSTASSAAAGSTCPPGRPGPSCAVTVAIKIPALGISLSADHTTIIAGGTVAYTLVLTNPGESAYAAATVTDSLAGVLDDAAYNGDATASSGTVHLTGSDLAWTGELAVGATVVVTFTVTVANPDPGDLALHSAVSSTARGNTCPAGNSNPACASTITVSAQTIAVSDLTGSFTLAGDPDTTVSQQGAVTMTVTTNSPTGYAVTVQPGGTQLVPDTPGNPDRIPITDLGVRLSGTPTYTALVPGTPVTVYSQDRASSPTGDGISNDYSVHVPFVRSDTYSATLDYVANTL
jgi:uncharacterized repeat protein (TIGR01451 family)